MSRQDYELLLAQHRDACASRRGNDPEIDRLFYQPEVRQRIARVIVGSAYRASDHARTAHHASHRADHDLWLGWIGVLIFGSVFGIGTLAQSFYP